MAKVCGTKSTGTRHQRSVRAEMPTPLLHIWGVWCIVMWLLATNLMAELNLESKTARSSEGLQKLNFLESISMVAQRRVFNSLEGIDNVSH